MGTVSGGNGQRSDDSAHGSGATSFGLVIFAKNEGPSIGALIDSLVQTISRDDIFVMDGHSSDNTPEIVRERHVRCLLDPGRGKGAAIRLAIREIDRDILVFMDSDGSHKPDEIPSLLKPFGVDQDVVMVVGSRFLGGSEELSGSPQEWLRRTGNLVSNIIINARWRVRLTDTQNGFRAVRRRAVLALDLKEDTFAIEQELTMQCLKQRMKILEVPSFELKRAHGTSHVILHKMVPVYSACFVRNVFSRDGGG